MRTATAVLLVAYLVALVATMAAAAPAPERNSPVGVDPNKAPQDQEFNLIIVKQFCKLTGWC
ncbi:hypothetical protein H9P43_004512 [Blastocladiella emersonii ATCC 22665]|nr:hypothetical protein H9P43_004512 [Blastocladiella emersonii ATCC 22665]